MVRRAQAARSALKPWALALATLQALASPASGQSPAAQGERHAVMPPPGTPVTFDQALGLAARAPAVLGAEAAVDEQRRVGDSVSSMIANPTLTVQPGAAKDPLDNQWKYSASPR